VFPTLKRFAGFPLSTIQNFDTGTVLTQYHGRIMAFCRSIGFGLCLVACLASVRADTTVATNTIVRVMAANLTSGSAQSYEAAGIRIFQGLKPDIVAIQEFNYGDKSATAIRSFVDTAFGTNYSYFRESGNGYTIPNGIISRYPFKASGSWVDVDTGVNDRGFAWGQIDLPGTNDLYVVSIHFKASSGSDNAARRYAQATNLWNLITANFPVDAWIVVAGDCNIFDPSELAYQYLVANLSDFPIPTDAVSGGDADTNLGRTERYDYVFPSRSLTNQMVATTLPSRTFTKGLVFDSRWYTPLMDVYPVQSGDSEVSGMQHMAVVRSFSIPYLMTVTNVVPPPTVRMRSPQVIEWTGPSNVVYRVESRTDLTSTSWTTLGTSTSTSTNYSFTNQAGIDRAFFRVAHP